MPRGGSEERILSVQEMVGEGGAIFFGLVGGGRGGGGLEDIAELDNKDAFDEGGGDTVA